jgi:histidinol-phosphate aminotransferase
MTATFELSKSQPAIKDICLGSLGCGSSRVDKKPTFDLSLSENPFPPLPSVLHAVTQALTEANLYPEFIPHRLPKVIGDRIGVNADQVVVGSGATGVAMQIMQALTAPGDGIVFGSPTFDGFPMMAEMIGLDTVPIPLKSDGQQDLWAMSEAVDERTKLLIVCRPHNPTGTLVSAGELEALLRVVPRRVTVILDEAYVEFLRAEDAIDTAALINRHSNVIVLRTFSKAYGLAGMRIGYAFGGLEVIRRVHRLRLLFGVSAATAAAVTSSFAAQDELSERIERITAERDLLRARLRRNGVRVLRSHANFLYLPGSDIADRLAQAGIQAKRYPDGSARIAVGDPAATRAVLHALTPGRAGRGCRHTYPVSAMSRQA